METFKRLLLFIFMLVVITAILGFSNSFIVLASVTIVPSEHCSGGDCCINSNCSCPSCDGRGEPGGICDLCGGDLCENCGNCHNCGTKPCPVCRADGDYICALCGGEICATCGGCKDCGVGWNPECPDCGDLLSQEISFRDLDIEGNPVPLFSRGGFELLLFAPFGTPAWAILSVLLTVAGIVMTVITILQAVRQKKDEDKKFDEYIKYLKNVDKPDYVDLVEIIEEKEKYNKKRRLGTLYVMYVLSISAVLILLIAQDFKGIIVLFDWWVILHTILFASIIICNNLVFRKHED
ncbi:MAG: hypothetical protein LBD23_16830 [Oscillospiraceae bacterium]|jgi:hypothetical protein|nr:hypothetical protein [Oscillospiraceae bacterium]